MSRELEDVVTQARRLRGELEARLAQERSPFTPVVPEYVEPDERRGRRRRKQ